jgi:hypothetical protein
LIAVDLRRRRSDSVSGSNEPCAPARDLGDPQGHSLKRVGNTRVNCSPWLLSEHDKPPVQTLTAAVLSLRVINPAQPTLWLEIHTQCIFCRPAKRAIDAASGHRAKIISRAIGVVCLLMLAMWNVSLPNTRHAIDRFWRSMAPLGRIGVGSCLETYL